jgi:uncharacterized membrane protein YkvA (DUF1232 family)
MHGHEIHNKPEIIPAAGAIDDYFVLQFRFRVYCTPGGGIKLYLLLKDVI